MLKAEARRASLHQFRFKIYLVSLSSRLAFFVLHSCIFVGDIARSLLYMEQPLKAFNPFPELWRPFPYQYSFKSVHVYFDFIFGEHQVMAVLSVPSIRGLDVQNSERGAISYDDRSVIKRHNGENVMSWITTRFNTMDFSKELMMKLWRTSASPRTPINDQVLFVEYFEKEDLSFTVNQIYILQAPLCSMAQPHCRHLPTSRGNKYFEKASATIELFFGPTGNYM